MLKSGDRLPAFSLTDGEGNPVSNAMLKGRRVVLYLYPKDDTPGCTIEACAFRDAMADFKAAGVAVYGLSADSAARHQKFAAKYGLTFPLIADPERVLIEGLGAWVEKSMYGRAYMGIARCTFLIAADGRIEQVWETVKPATHATEVLAAIRGEALAVPAKTAKKPVTKAAKNAPPKAASKKTTTKKTATKKTAAKKATPRR